MSKVTKKRRCQQCGIILNKASIDVLIEHMESSDLCKEAVRTCEGCYMKFPDDTSLMRHIGLKKLCLERHNMGHADPTIVHRGQSTSGSAAEEGMISAISFQSARKNDDLPPRSQDNSGYLNSYVTYAFPHNSNMTSTSHPMSSQKESGLLHSSSIDQWLDEEEDNGAQSGPIENFNMVGDSRIPHIDNYLEIGAKYAVVQTVTGNDFNYRGRRFHLKSHLAVRYTLERHLRLIEIDSIERLTFVVMNDIGNLGNDDNAEEEPGSIIMFKDRSVWKDLFLEL